MFAPCLLGRPGTGRQGPVLMSLRLAGLRYSSACHSISVTQVFKKALPSSGLLIRGFGVQVPGGAPDLTWGFTVPGHFFRVRFVHMFAPCLLARTDPAIRGLSKTARPVPNAASGSLDQWSRPPARFRERSRSPLYRCRHAQCNLLVNGTRTADTSPARAPHTRRLPARHARDSGICFRVAVPTAADARGANPLGTSRPRGARRRPGTTEKSERRP
jgi:hypothetical protein